MVGSAFTNLRRFERTYIVDKTFKPVKCCTDEMKEEFKEIWSRSITGIPDRLLNHLGSHNREQFTIDATSWEEIEDITSIDISCEKVAEAYKNYMSQHDVECDL